jgi:hypothetical protein
MRWLHCVKAVGSLLATSGHEKYRSLHDILSGFAWECGGFVLLINLDD